MSEFQSPLARIIAIVDRLRDPVDCCDWDRVQTFETIAPDGPIAAWFGRVLDLYGGFGRAAKTV